MEQYLVHALTKCCIEVEKEERQFIVRSHESRDNLSVQY